MDATIRPDVVIISSGAGGGSAGFFPSSAALNPALTVCAQALHVGAHLRHAWRQDTLAA